MNSGLCIRKALWDPDPLAGKQGGAVLGFHTPPHGSMDSNDTTDLVEGKCLANRKKMCVVCVPTLGGGSTSRLSPAQPLARTHHLQPSEGLGLQLHTIPLKPGRMGPHWGPSRIGHRRRPAE